ncbi:hypothetical protein [Psychrobacter maritimus]|uniref:ORC-CDC6 family AAA ATPase n=1 Tax=Psychrobacter maritimus TaxID=256325 RepID=UPI0019195C07|nr:hypothetical protein [Psychrobacter maritimus]
MKIIDIINSLSTARMEHQTSNGSVLNRFVVPYFIDRLDLRNISHSIALVGSRGSGKSTFIQYFSHSTRFDKKKSTVDMDEFKSILFYWKPDTSYCQGLNKEWLGSDAMHFFNLHASLSLIEEILQLLKNSSHHFPEIITELDNNEIFWKAISKVTKQKITTLEYLEEWINEYKYEVSTRINPINTTNLLSPQPKPMLSFLLSSLKKSSSFFQDTNFKVYIDEFELLNVDQQKLINTYRKESNKDINWNVAYKFNSKPTRETTSDQWLQSPDDYREENLDKLIENDYRIYAAEIFILSLQNAGLTCNSIKLNPEFLGDRTKINIRKEQGYKKAVINIISKILPTPSISELSEKCLLNNSIQTKLKDVFQSLDIDSKFLKKAYSNPSLAITMIGTYKQKSFDKKIFCDYMDDIIDDVNRKKVKGKIDTFEYNTLLTLNLQHSSVETPLYAGFERFITMTTPNIRHFKELCLSSLKYSDDFDEESVEYETVSDIKPISELGMHLGAISTSSDLLKEIVSYPPHGRKLSQMVNRIGDLFKLSQNGSYQTEPERAIFTIDYDFSGSDLEIESLIDSAICWRVLVEDKLKRRKNETNIKNKEFQLNPIYSPNFGISYRKKTDLSLTLENFKIIVNGDSDSFSFFLKDYQKKWNSDSFISTQGILL